jgi:cold shock CspA family protein
MVATITFFNDKKGYGFVTTGTGEQIFFHRTNLADKAMRADTQLVGRKVEFDFAPAIAQQKKPQAVNVRTLPDANVREGGIAALGGGQ